MPEGLLQLSDWTAGVDQVNFLYEFHSNLHVSVSVII